MWNKINSSGVIFLAEKPIKFYGYLNDLNKLECEILNNTTHDSNSLSGSSVKIVKREMSKDLSRKNMFGELENLKDDIQSASTVMDLMRQLRMDKMGETMSIHNSNYDDVITVSRHTLVVSEPKNVHHTILH